MSRVKTGPNRRRRHKKVLKGAKGFRQARSKHVRAAHEALLHAGEYAYAGRKLRKRDFRRLWISRINAALKEEGLSYRYFINSLKEAKIGLNRKMLAEIALEDPKAFQDLLNRIRAKKN